MERALGYITELTPEAATVHVHRAGGREGIATVPLSMFGEWERGRLQEGTYLEVEIDHTELVTRVVTMPVPMWTQKDLDAAKAEGERLAKALRWK